MKTGKRMKKGCALALAALLALPCLDLMQAQAAKEIDLNRDCSLTVSVDVGAGAWSSEDWREDFSQMEIPVSVYRVADVDVTGQTYTPQGAFAGLDLSKYNQRGSSLTADEWLTLASQADQMRETSHPEAAASMTVGSGETGTAEGLKPGLYLVAPQSSYNPDYSVQYTFAPYLTALPGNVYAETGEGSDDWVYETIVGLKPDAEPQLGSLNITKNLLNYNASLGQATFVFRITGRDEAGAVQFEEVESMTYTAAGSNTLVLHDIPAGLSMTVEEIYSGASYEAVGSNTRSVEISSDAAVEAGAAQTASVAFENRYDGGNRGGYGVTNHFESDGAGGWTWQNPTTPAGQ